MTQRDDDDIAKALHGLSSGEHVEPEPVESSGTGQAQHLDPAGAQSGAAPPAPLPLAVPFRATRRPAPPSAGAASDEPKRPVPPMRPRPQPQPQPAPGGRAATPSPTQPAAARPSSPAPQRRVTRNILPPGARPPTSPASPNLTPPGGAAEPASAEVETTNVQPVDEDDVVIVPAAPLSALGPRIRRPAARVPMFKSIQFRRTAIPILLTTGLMLFVVAGLKFVVNPDAVLATLPIGMCLAMVGAGVVLLGVAALNMVMVHHQLAAERMGPLKG